MNDRRRRSGRLQFLLIAAVFFGPLIVAAWLYFAGGSLEPEGRTNHGTLLEPIVGLGEVFPESPALAAETWILVYENGGDCDDPCRQALYTMRQSRLMLGREMDRVTRVFLHGQSPPDTLFLAEQHEGLISLEDAALAAFLNNKKPGTIRAGGYYLIDPLDNLVMYFGPGLDPGDMVDDIKRLLRLSRIG